MQLELNPDNLICRLDNMKNVLSKGKVINQKKILDLMGDKFEESKKRHQEL